MTGSRLSPELAKERAQHVFEKGEQRKRDAASAWKALDDRSEAVRENTIKLKAQRLAKEAADAETAKIAAEAAALAKAAIKRRPKREA